MTVHDRCQLIELDVGGEIGIEVSRVKDRLRLRLLGGMSEYSSQALIESNELVDKEWLVSTSECLELCWRVTFILK